MRRGESYVAGGSALNEILGAPRLSHDVDLFHDTEEALVASWQMDRSLLSTAGFSPASILAEARRTVRYSALELRGLDYQTEPPDPGALLQDWRAQLADAGLVVGQLPPDKAGTAVLDGTGHLYRGNPDSLSRALVAGELSYHEGSIRGAFPQFA
jgi:hypothetical protein